MDIGNQINIDIRHARDDFYLREESDSFPFGAFLVHVDLC